MDLENHPCFNESACRSFGRVHLPVASRCNVQCNFCNRRFDCVNESRPGVTSGLLSPDQAVVYLEEVMAERHNISVVGIAGPGDPFANPLETIRTLELVRARHPEILLCLATNGLNIMPYVDEMARLKVSHVSITVNALDQEIGARIYAWVRQGKRNLGPEKGAAVMRKNQLAAIASLKERGVTVKVNSVVIPGINDHHIKDIAAEMAKMEVDIFNCMPYCPNPGSRFEDLREPSQEEISRIREEAGRYIKQMRHCTRCRADAVGLLGEAPDRRMMDLLRAMEAADPVMPAGGSGPERPYVAVASMEGLLVNQHLGEAIQLYVYARENGRVALKDIRPTPEPGGGPERWRRLSETIRDCSTLLVSGAGGAPREILKERGIEIHEVEGIIEAAVLSVFEGHGLSPFLKRRVRACGAGCNGTGLGCG